MPPGSSIWVRWKALARRAAYVQSNVILLLLYVVVFVPLALLRRPFAEPIGHDHGLWRERPPTPRDVASARRQS